MTDEYGKTVEMSALRKGHLAHRGYNWFLMYAPTLSGAGVGTAVLLDNVVLGGAMVVGALIPALRSHRVIAHNMSTSLNSMGDPIFESKSEIKAAFPRHKSFLSALGLKKYDSIVISETVYRDVDNRLSKTMSDVGTVGILKQMEHEAGSLMMPLSRIAKKQIKSSIPHHMMSEQGVINHVIDLDRGKVNIKSTFVPNSGKVFDDALETLRQMVDEDNSKKVKGVENIDKKEIKG